MMKRENREVRLLVVDDLESNRFAFQRILESEPYCLDMASSADEALRLMLHHRYACILCDVNMPEVDGFEFARIVRDDPDLSDTPIVFVTAHGTSDDYVRRSVNIGAYDFVSKPIDPTLLRGKLRVFAELYRKSAEVLERNQLLEAIIDNMVEGLAVISRDGDLVYSNDQLSACLGSTPPTAQFLDWFGRLGWLHPETETEVDPNDLPLTRALKGETAIDEESFLRQIGPVGSYLSVTTTPIDEGSKEPSFVVLLVRDVSERKRHELAIRSKNRDLEQFAYVASHDLKAPLRHITSFTEILTEELAGARDPNELASALSVIQAGTREMKQLIDGLLEFSSIGKESLRIEPLRVDQLILDIRASLGIDRDDTTIEIVDETPEINGDRDRLKQVFQNLILNSMKFRSTERPLRIEVSVTDTRDRSQIRVRDNGIGIPPKYGEKVFQIFQRLHSKKTYEGSGIGLSICKRVVEMHDGNISFDSDGTSGTCFLIDLPKRRGPSPSHE